MIVTVLRSSFKKGPPKIILYRDYCYYSHSNFRWDLESHFSLNEYVICNMSNDKFVEVFMNIFENHAPIKQKIVRCDQSALITKQVRKEIMKRTFLRNRFLKSKSDLSRELYNKQRNYCTYLIKKAKKDYYSKLNPSSIANSKTFWRTVKLLFTDKILANDNIVLVENREIINESYKIAEIFKCLFSNAVKDLGIVTDSDTSVGLCEELTDPILEAINKYKDHPSIKKINQVTSNINSFPFSHTTPKDIELEIESLNNRAACPNSNIPPKIIKENLDIFSMKLYKDFNQAIDETMFPQNCKCADITPVHKKDNKMDKSNYRPVSILPAMAKIFRETTLLSISNLFR